MPAYLIVHPRDQHRDDILIEDTALVLRFDGGWAVFLDGNGIAFALPCGQGASIQRVDEPTELAPQEG